MPSSALRPFIANMPCGRFWMKTMMNTSTAILASTAPAQPSSNLFSTPRPSAAYDGARELADAAQHDHHERVDDVALAEVGPDVADLRQRAAGQAGDARAEREGERVDARGVDAHARAIGRFCVTPRTNRPSRVRRSGAPDAEQDREGEADDDDAVAGQHQVAASPRRRRDIQLGFSTCTFCAPNSERTACISTRLMPQVASSVSSGRP